MTSERGDEGPAASAPEQGSSGPGSEAGPAGLEAQWCDHPDDPDAGRHLGYEWIPFEVFGEKENADELLVLPADEELITDDAYIAVDPDHLQDLEGWT